MTIKEYHLVKHKASEKSYYVCRVPYTARDKPTVNKLFVIDSNKYNEVIAPKYNWCFCTPGNNGSGYISHSSNTVMLHNVVLGMERDGSKVYDETADHHNRVRTDNRRENLRSATQSEQNVNRDKTKRISEHLKDDGVDKDELPPGMIFQYEGGRKQFVFEREINGVKFNLHSGNNDYNVKQNFEIIKYRILQFVKKNSDKVTIDDIMCNPDDDMIELITSYNEILKESPFQQSMPKCVKKNLAVVPENKKLHVDKDLIRDYIRAQKQKDKPIDIDGMKFEKIEDGGRDVRYKVTIDLTKNPNKNSEIEDDVNELARNNRYPNKIRFKYCVKTDKKVILPPEGTPPLPVYTGYRSDRNGYFIIERHPGYIGESTKKTWYTPQGIKTPFVNKIWRLFLQYYRFNKNEQNENN